MGITLVIEKATGTNIFIATYLLIQNLLVVRTMKTMAKRTDNLDIL
jgi:hypothetical protein